MYARRPILCVSFHTTQRCVRLCYARDSRGQYSLQMSPSLLWNMMLVVLRSGEYRAPGTTSLTLGEKATMEEVESCFRLEYLWVTFMWEWRNCT
ncbi:hypothetical protein AVEN_136274-1 [Araneus ventricosus]|uniref:Uncharacterized protein n=1 Tax=Araneus ventricosus TaxID=182803 RepID=A0A4Y2L8E5_ARAVE|nr:hypothetical protein AVEN_136274-1 [Araneus ventricosus]